MARSSRNAFKGYSYQKCVYAYFTFKMDIDRKIFSVQAEILPDGHNFDDIMLTTTEGKDYYIQAKNYDAVKNISINDDSVIINGVKSIKRQDLTNVFILKSYNADLNNNSKIFGLDAHFEKGVYIIVISPKDLLKEIQDLYKGSSRIYQILLLIDEYSTSDNNVITQTNLPDIKFFSNQLLEKTIKLRKFKLSDECGVYCIVGKPGVGKSHLVNEISIEKSCLYRFWISEQDKDKRERLYYQNFIDELGKKLFNDFLEHKEVDIIECLIKQDTTLIIDGLDHVENYNIDDLDKYFDFIDKINNTKKIKLIILTRPLKKKIPWASEKLENWCEDETRAFLREKYNINDYDTFKKIFEITDGYPIITDFIAHHYINNGEIPSLEKINDINIYYDRLISNIQLKNLLVLFTLTDSYLTFNEIQGFLTPLEYSLVKDFIGIHKYLFDIRLNRITLIHDSLNTYLINKVGYDKNLENRLIDYVKGSIEREELRFLYRINSFNLDFDYKKNILKKYSNFDAFNKLISNNIDIEAILEFYYKLKSILEKCDEGVFDIYQYYEFILIICIASRDHLSGSSALVYNQLRYYKENNINIVDNIYSEGTVFGMYYTLVTKNEKFYSKKLNDEMRDSENEISHMYDEINNELDFFDNLNKDIDFKKYEENKVINQKEASYSRHFNMAELLSRIFIKNVKYKNYYDIINDFINGKKGEAVGALERIFINYGIEKYMALWTLNDAKEKIYQYGLCRDQNPYCQSTIKDIIEDNRLNGSFDINKRLTAYIRLALKEKRKIDIEFINEYYCMYYEHKDYTALTLPTALKCYYDKKIIGLNDCIRIIQNAQEMSDKGIRHILYEFINMLDNNEILIMVEEGTFPGGKIWVNNLDTRIIDIINEDYVVNKIDEEMYRSAMSRLIRYSDIDNLIASKYNDYTLRLISDFHIKIHDAPTSFKCLKYNIEITYKDEIKTGDEIPFERGYLSASDYDYIKSKGIDHIELSKMLDGWHSKFAVISLYDMFDKEILKNDILKIIHTTLKYGRTDFNYEGSHNYYLGNIPEFIRKIEYDVDWGKTYSIFYRFLNISKIV